MKIEMLKFCSEKGILVDKYVLEVLESIEDFEIARGILEKITFQFNQKIITKGFFIDNKHQLKDLLSYHSGEKKELIETAFNKLGLSFFDDEVEGVKEIREEANLKPIKLFQNNPRKLEVKDFVKNFRNRFNDLKNILQQRNILDNLISINHIGDQRNFSLIVLIYDKKITKNGNVLLQIEDLTGKTTALINKNRPEIFEKSKEILLDEVIGIKCSGNGEIVFINDIYFPDMQILEKKKSNEEEYVAFTSDMHIGSDKFLESKFLKFINWLNGEVGNERQREDALKVRYLFITGDSIDGVGVYPGQETQLIIQDVDQQYEMLFDLLSKIRKDVNIVMCAGQHDAVRVAEPQPIIGEYYGVCLKSLSNLSLVTNPSIIEIGKDVKFKVLMYHGASMHGVINSIESLRLGKAHDSPTDVVKYLLKKRHLAPTHSLVTYIPLEKEDALLIKDVPDIVATGDLHRPQIADYNGITLIASSCWQAKTPFEEKVGNNPDPCKVPILNLKTREVKIMDFSDDK